MDEQYILLALMGYLLGSVPFGLYVAQQEAGWAPLAGNVNPLEIYRRRGRRARLRSAAAFALEMLKGLAPTLAGYLTLGIPGAVGGGSAALIGHNFPALSRLRGSSSVAPYLGVLLAIYPVAIVILAMVWLAALGAWRYYSLSALVAAAVLPLVLAALNVGDGESKMVVLGAAGWALLAFYAHRRNIARLIAGTEPRAGKPEPPIRRRVR